MVKANAYGLGLAPVIRTLQAEGCDTFFVAVLSEALELRRLCPTARVLLLSGPTDSASAAAIANARVEPVLNQRAHRELWRPYQHLPAVLHLDTGMQRLGFAPEELQPQDWQAFKLSLFMTHLACADAPEHPANQQQLHLFRQTHERFSQLPTSIANSAGCLLPEDWHGDLTRPGIGLYGGHPQNRITDNPMRPVVSMHGQVVQRRQVATGTPVGYGGSFVAPVATELALVGLGYADGLPRVLSNNGEVSINGLRAPIVGRISMDLVHVDVTDLPTPPEVGDWVEFLGADIGVDEVAQWAGTIGLEVLCGLGARPTWTYEGDPADH